MPLKKTVTFTEEKQGVEPHPDLKLDYSFLSVTEQNSVIKKPHLERTAPIEMI